MALATGTIFEVRASATTGNVNGAGFNTANANFLTNLTTDANTGNTASPVVSSASYNFAAGDVGAWVYIKAGTNWYANTWFQIASVASNKATLSADIGQGRVQSGLLFTATTVAGVASVATPTSGTFGVDYSQQDARQVTATDFAAVGASTTLTSVTAAFTPVMVGNIYHQTTTGTGAFGIVGWYEIVSYTNATTVVLDRTPNTGTASVACTGFVGGAGRMNALEDAFGEMLPAGAIAWNKNGTYTFVGNMNITGSNGTATSPISWLGYNTVRGDTCNGDNRPLFAVSTLQCNFANNHNLYNMRFTTTSAVGVLVATNGTAKNCKALNSADASTPDRVGFTSNAAGSKFLACEAVSQNGNAWSGSTVAGRSHGCYYHDSNNGVISTTSALVVQDCIIEGNRTAAITTAQTGLSTITGNTLYGREAKQGSGVIFTGASSSGCMLGNNIIYGFSTGVNVTTAQGVDMDYFNDYFNNTTDVTNFVKGGDSIALNPTFAGATQITGATATSSGSVLTQSGGDFSTVTDNVDYLHVLTGTGVTTGGYLITSHTSTTLTVNNALGTSSAGDITYYVTTGHNFAIGTNLKAAGFPRAFSGSETTGYMDIGAVQRQEASMLVHPGMAGGARG